MSQIKASLACIALVSGLFLSGCGDKNPQVVFDREHAPGWLGTHKIAARANPDACRDCHGRDLSGGIANVSCMSPNTIDGLRCHITSPADNTTGCTSCHNGDAPPSSQPFGPNGITSPNRTGGHDKHGSIPYLTCSACHKGAGSGTSRHANAGGAAYVIFSSVYKAKKATAAPLHFFDGTCVNISCHGGKPAPAWGSANGLTCYSCHEQGTAYQVPEYNSFYSGLHASHLAKINPGTSVTITCSNCHDLFKLTQQQHFGGVATHSFVFPGNTIGGGSTRIGGYDPVAQGCNNVMCHTLVPPGTVQSPVHWFIF